jgi:hypothetical protein
MKTDPQRPVPRATGPGPGAGHERDPEGATTLHARIAIVATIVVGQLWGLTVALNAWLDGSTSAVWWILGFEALSFLLAVLVWLVSAKRPR